MIYINFCSTTDPNATCQVSRQLAQWFWRRRFFKGFEHFWAWWASSSCDLDHLYKLSFPLPKEAPHKIWLWSAKRFQRRRCLISVNGRRKTTTDAWPWVYYKLPLWAWRFRWAKKLKLLFKLVFMKAEICIRYLINQYSYILCKSIFSACL